MFIHTFISRNEINSEFLRFSETILISGNTKTLREFGEYLIERKINLTFTVNCAFSNGLKRTFELNSGKPDQM